MSRLPSGASTRTPALWAITVVFAAFTVITSLLPSLIPAGAVGIINTVLLVAFALVHGIAQYGVRGIVFFLIACLVVSNVAENVSILTGFPFGHYHYTDVLGPKIFLVPVTIGGAYFGAGYLSWTVAQILLGRCDKPLDAFGRRTLPIAAALLMASWDFMLDPTASTINHYWIWENGGGFFGVPFVNYLGWLLTVFIFFSIFAAYATTRSNASADSQANVRPGASFWALAIATYALLGVRYVLMYLTPSTDKVFTDAVGHAWMRHDIYETGALAAIFSVFSLSVLAGLRLADREGPERLAR